MLCRYYLKIGVSEIGDNLDGCLDCTEMICNSDDIEVSYKRTSPFGGVVRKCTSSIVFCNEAKDLIYQEYLNNYLNAKAAFALYTINNDWTYSKEYECPLDFSSLQYEGNTIEMNTIDQSVAAIIKANKSVKYEFPVSDIKDEKQLYYDRISLIERGEYTIVGETDGDYSVAYLGVTKSIIISNEDVPFLTPKYHTHVFIPLYILNSEYAINSIEYLDQELKGHDTDSNPEIINNAKLNDNGMGVLSENEVSMVALLEKKSDFSLNLNLEYFIKRKHIKGPNIEYSLAAPFKIQFLLALKMTDGNYRMENVGSYELRLGYPPKVEEKIDISIPELAKNWPRDIYFSIVFSVPITTINRMGYLHSEAIYLYYKITEFSINYPVKGNNEFIDIIKPKFLLDSILSKFNLVGKIDLNDNIKNTAILSAESIRGLDTAKLYTSFSDFCKWMEAVFGYVYEIENGIIVFKHRNSLFSSEIVADLTGHIDDILINLDSSNIYSSVRVGYNKQDYDSINGRDEFHFTNEYTTQIALTENKLELISPYRADCYGIEFLCQKRSEKTKDDESDNDVFFVDTNEEENFYILNRLPTSGVLSPDTIFNQSYRPSNIVMENKKYIGVFTPKLYFSSSEGNSDVSVNGVFESSDIELNQSLATVGKLKISSDIQKLPEGSFIGLFTFVLNGYRYTFYLDSVDFRYQREQQSTIEGIIKSIEKL